MNDHEQRRTPTDDLLTEQRLAEARQRLADRAEIIVPNAMENQQELFDLASASTEHLAVARRLLSANEPTARAHLARLQSETDTVLKETHRLATRYSYLEQKAASQRIQVLLAGVTGSGKSTVACTGTGIPGVVPSRDGHSVSGVTIRITHDPEADERYAILTLANGDRRQASGDEIDAWTSQFDDQDRPLYRYRGVVNAELHVRYRNNKTQIFDFEDSAGMFDGRPEEEERLNDAVDLQPDVILIIDKPIPGREILAPSNQAAYDLIDRVPSFVVLNHWLGNDKNCKLRRAELVSRGIPYDRIIDADCTQTKEVEHVLGIVLERLLTTEWQSGIVHATA